MVCFVAFRKALSADVSMHFVLVRRHKEPISLEQICLIPVPRRLLTP